MKLFPKHDTYSVENTAVFVPNATWTSLMLRPQAGLTQEVLLHYPSFGG